MLKPIKIYNSDESEPSANIRITCEKTNISMRWNDAARAGWFVFYKTGERTKYYSTKPE